MITTYAELDYDSVNYITYLADGSLIADQKMLAGFMYTIPGLISNGTVTLKVWKIQRNGTLSYNYLDFTDTVTKSLRLGVLDMETGDDEEKTKTISFISGKATIAW